MEISKPEDYTEEMYEKVVFLVCPDRNIYSSQTYKLKIAKELLFNGQVIIWNGKLAS